jgi:hypothetical protein
MRVIGSSKLLTMGCMKGLQRYEKFVAKSSNTKFKIYERIVLVFDDARHENNRGLAVATIHASKSSILLLQVVRLDEPDYAHKK